MRFYCEVSLQDKDLDVAIQHIQRAVERTIAAELEKLKADLREKVFPQLAPQQQGVSRWIELAESERQKATDLRMAILVGKIPEDTGLLIDVRTTAKLLNVSERMVYRLADQKAAPQPIKLGALVRWRLTEIIEWIDSGCPSRWQWPGHRKDRR